MKNTEKIVLKQISQSLKKSTETNWTSGYLDVWSDWALKMKNVINTSVPIIDALILDENNSENDEELDIVTTIERKISNLTKEEQSNLLERLVKIFTKDLEELNNNEKNRI
jgi:hypothetical protein